MKKLLLFLSLPTVTASIFAPHSLKAGESKFYVTGSGGVGFLNEAKSKKENYKIQSETLSLGLELDLENKSTFDVGVGYDLGKTRIEFNVNQQNTAIERTSFDATLSGATAIVGVSSKGDADATSYLITANRDFPSEGGWTPYIGAGIGMTNVTTKDVNAETGTLGDALNVNLGTTTLLKGDSATVFAYQLRSGIAKEITKNTDIFGEVSYTATEGWSAGSGQTKIDWKGISVIGTKIGFRYKF